MTEHNFEEINQGMEALLLAASYAIWCKVVKDKGLKIGNAPWGWGDVYNITECVFVPSIGNRLYARYAKHDPDTSYMVYAAAVKLRKKIAALNDDGELDGAPHQYLLRLLDLKAYNTTFHSLDTIEGCYSSMVEEATGKPYVSRFPYESVKKLLDQDQAVDQALRNGEFIASQAPGLDLDDLALFFLAQPEKTVALLKNFSKVLSNFRQAQTLPSQLAVARLSKTKKDS